jgi:branched-chain amino acid transport system ATP-binding protein
MDLVLENVTKNFGGLRAVGGVGFTVKSKSIFGLIGPNGAGKTTVFNLITGVYKHDQGSIHFDGKDLRPLKPAQIAAVGVARTFQNIRLFSQLTVIENLLVACELQKRAHLAAATLRLPAHYEDEEAMNKRAIELLRVFDLQGVADEPSTSLPYGNQRRLEIARAMMLEPKLLLLDEPAAGMNYGEAEGLKTQIRWLRDTFDLSVVLVEHNMQVVMGVCEEIHVLDHGETIAHGTPEAVRTHPKVLAAYLGEDETEVAAEPSTEGAPFGAAPRSAEAAKGGMRVAHPERPKLEVKPGEPLLELDDVRVAYGGIKALKGVSLEVFPGEIVAMIGANGAGKTTTLKSVMGLLPVASGTIKLGGKSTAGRSTEDLVEAGISLAPEGRAIFPNLTVRENLELGAYLHRDRTTMRETLEDVTRLFPRLGERMSQEGGTLSGGEQQMLAIGRALMARPQLLLLDEPSLGIAPKLVQQIFAAIREIAASGVTILVVEQNTRIALATASRAYVLRTGEIALSGKAKELAANPEIQAAYLGG